MIECRKAISAVVGIGSTLHSSKNRDTTIVTTHVSYLWFLICSSRNRSNFKLQLLNMAQTGLQFQWSLKGSREETGAGRRDIGSWAYCFSKMCSFRTNVMKVITSWEKYDVGSEWCQVKTDNSKLWWVCNLLHILQTMVQNCSSSDKERVHHKIICKKFKPCKVFKMHKQTQKNIINL